MAGTRGGLENVYRDRIGLAISVLLVVGAFMVPIQVWIGGYVRRTPEETIVPILITGIPAFLALIIAAPYQKRGRFYRTSAIAACVLAGSAVLNVMGGFFRD